MIWKHFVKNPLVSWAVRIAIWSYNCLVKIVIISYLKLYDCMQTNDYYYQAEMITGNHLIIN